MKRLVLLCLAAGCLPAPPTPQDQVDEVAQAYCGCVLPGDKTCVTQFETAITTVSDACVQCVFDHEHRCAAMQTDCTQLCVGGP